MKRIIIIVLTLAFCLSFAACNAATDELPEAPVPTSDAPDPAPTSQDPASPAAPDPTVPEASPDPVPEPPKSLKIGYMSDDPSSGFYKNMLDSLEAAVAAAGHEFVPVLTYRDPVQMRAAFDQLKMMEVDIIIDLNSVVDIVRPFAEEAKEEGIPFLALYINLGEPYYCFGTDNGVLAQIKGTFLGERIKEEWGGKVDGIMLVGNFTGAPDVARRVIEAVPAMGEIIDVSGIEPIRLQTTNPDVPNTVQLVTNTLAANPGKRFAMFCQNDDQASAAVSAVDAAGRSADVMATGSDCLPIARDYWKAAVDAGNLTPTWRGSIYISTPEHCALIVKLAEDIAAGKSGIPYYSSPDLIIGGPHNFYELFPEMKG